MKKTIICSLAIISGIIVFQSCDQNKKASEKEQNTETTKEIAHVDYQCPMDCEKGKTYHEAGKCPVCGMELEKAGHKEATKDTTAHDEKHEHKEGDGHKH